LAGNHGSGDGTNNDAWFQAPSGVAVDSGGNVYVADWSNDTIRKLTPAGTNWVSSTIAELGGDGVAVDGAGNLYVADMLDHTIRKLSPWMSSTIGGLAGYAGSDDGTNSAARFWNPNGLAVDSAGNVYVADTDNNTIRQGMPVPWPMFVGLTQDNGLLTFTWSTVEGQGYQLQFNSNLNTTNWNDLGTSIIATKQTSTATDMMVPGQQRFYRVMLLP
jgi:hypothetical protein